LLAFFGTMNLILLSRLWLTFKDDGADTKTILKISIVPFLSLIFVETGLLWIMVLIVLSISPLLTFFSEKKSSNIYRARGLVLFVHILVLGLIFGLLGENGLNDRAAEVIQGSLILNQPSGSRSYTRKPDSESAKYTIFTNSAFWRSAGDE